MPHIALYKLKLLDEFEDRHDAWTYADFERRLEQVRPTPQGQDAKAVIVTAHKDGAWPQAVKRFLLTCYHLQGGFSAELNKVFEEVVARMTPLERSAWGVDCGEAANPLLMLTQRSEPAR
ncbi:hypothetical protein [Pseudomonas putida]|uniref:hypothetical protein n=1 Tax=Pseudomonas putida TaxID=303 RepID=UPI00186596E2|nr:hypothetical protein [Pseudomonas putida]